MNVFTPVFRCHEGNRPWSNVQFSNDEVIDHFKKMSEYYSHLSTYNDFVREEYYNKGLPINRPLFYEFSDEASLDIKNEFMYGSDILVSPVITPKETSKDVYLPEGSWVQMFTGIEFNGGTHKVETPIGRPIAFYKKDSKFSDLFKSMEEV